MEQYLTDTAAEELNALCEPQAEQYQAIASEELRELAGRLAGLTLSQQVITLAIWPFMENILAFLVGFVDTALAGHLSVEATNAIGVGTYVSWLIGLIQAAVGMGCTAVVARAVGGRRRDLADSALGQSMILALAAGLGIGLLVFLLATPIGRFTNLSGTSLEFSTIYLRVMGIAAPFSAVLFVGAAGLRAAGDTRTPFFVFCIVNVVNAALAICFVYAPAPVGGHGVRGIAAATLTAWMVGALLILAVLAGGWGGLRLRLRRMRPHGPAMLRIARVAFPNLMESFFGLWIANFFVLRIVGLLHNPAAWAAHIVTVRAEAISFLPGLALGVAASTLAGQYLGLGDPVRARRAILLCWGFGAGVMFLMGLLFILMPEAFIRLITDEPQILQTSPGLLRIAGFVQVLFGTSIVLGQGMRGAGDTLAPMLLTMLSTYAVRLPLAYVFGILLDWGLRGVWAAMCLELAFRGVVFGIRFFYGGWARAEV